MKKLKSTFDRDTKETLKSWNENIEEKITFFIPVIGDKTCEISKQKLIEIIRQYKNSRVDIENEIFQYAKEHGKEDTYDDLGGQLTYMNEEKIEVDFNIDELKKILGI
jgi:hypothetical protein